MQSLAPVMELAERSSNEPFPVCHDQRPDWQCCRCPGPVRGYVDCRLTSTERRKMGKTRRHRLSNIVGGPKTKKPFDCQKLFDKILGVHELHVWRLAGDGVVASAHIHCQTAADYVQIAGDVKKFFHCAGIQSTATQPEFFEDNHGIFQAENERSAFDDQRYHSVVSENFNSRTAEAVIPPGSALDQGQVQDFYDDKSLQYIDDCQSQPVRPLPPSTKRLTSIADSDSGYYSGTTSPTVDNATRHVLPEVDDLELQQQQLDKITEQQQQTENSQPWPVIHDDIHPVRSSSAVTFSPISNGVYTIQSRTSSRRSSFQFPFFGRRRNRKTSGSARVNNSNGFQRNIVNGENRENLQPDENGNSYAKVPLVTTPAADAGKPFDDWCPTSANDRLLEWKNNVGSDVCINKSTSYITDTGEFVYCGRRENSSIVAKNKHQQQQQPQQEAATAAAAAKSKKSDRKNLTGEVAANYLKQLSHHLPPEDYQVFGYVKQGETIKPLVHRPNATGCTRVGGDLEACAIQCDGATVAYHRWRGVQGILYPPSYDPWGGIDIGEHFLAQLPPMQSSADDD